VVVCDCGEFVVVVLFGVRFVVDVEEFEVE